jgi:aspartyl-tRNA(Asn)/glutamyl-tRNA(Gln) amidotransferase subunit C
MQNRIHQQQVCRQASGKFAVTESTVNSLNLRSTIKNPISMSVTRNDVLYMANLARLNLPEDEVELLARDMNKILQYIELLNNIDTTDVPPLEYVIEPDEHFRKDIALEPLDHELALKNAPDADSDYFRVPRVIE